MLNKNKIIINKVIIDNIDYSGLSAKIYLAIDTSKQISIAYANANTINLTYKDKKLIDTLNSFDIIHPDGIGVYFASRYLYGRNIIPDRITGSDLYLVLALNAEKNKWKIFFFGHDEDTLSKISNYIPGLIVSGTHNGFVYDDLEIINQINSSQSDILIVGLGTPIQENWVNKYKTKLNSKVILCVGEGIKVFAGEKRRGPVFLRKFGLEWLTRFIANPIKYFKRYIIGNPLFLYRIFIIKMRKLA